MIEVFNFKGKKHFLDWKMNRNTFSVKNKFFVEFFFHNYNQNINVTGKSFFY